ncbi:hypothetical protein K474DRAFT_1662815 [Panus rudis PR-1116 ss-1]|nr:hypothetical protein K474DRAFT_1662815 [Panus rudis PR-1116 ss-1]
MIHWSTIAAIILEGLVVVLVQSFYIHRIWVLSRTKWVVLLTSFLLLSRFGFGITAAIYGSYLETWPEFHTKQGPMIALNGADAASAFMDAAIAFCMIYYLGKQCSSYNMGTDSIIRWVLAYTVNTGALTLILAIVMIIFFVALKQSLIFGGFLFLISRVYANSLLGSLNARIMLRNKVEGSIDNAGIELSPRSLPKSTTASMNSTPRNAILP